MTEAATGHELVVPFAPSAGRVHPVVRFVARRIAVGIATLLAASILVFVGTSVIPGSPASAVLGREATPRGLAQIDQRLGYDQSAVDRYLTWLGDMLHGDLGNSGIAVAQGATKAPIWPIIRGPLLNTTILALVTLAFLIPLSLLLGTLAGVMHRRWADHAISTLTLTFMSMPEFVVGSMLIVIFSAGLALLPSVSLLAPGAFPLAHPTILILPVMTLLAVSVAWTVRLVRVGVIEVLQSDFVQTARLHGIRERTVLRRYVLRNALAPSVQVFALSVQYLFGGVIVTEAVFSYPGLGKQLVDSVVAHDNTEVQAIAMVLAVIYIGINILADLIVMLLVPKLRTEL